MRNFLTNTIVLFFITAISFGQNQTIEKGSYLTTDNNLGLRLKLNLLENNKYELVFWEGDYEIKQDSLLLKDNGRVIFDVDYTYDDLVDAGKIKVKFAELYYYGFYIGTQKGNDPIQYQKLSDIGLVNNQSTDSILNFEIDHAQFLYLVSEGYDSNEASKVLKYEIPAKATGVVIKYQPYSEMPELKGYFDKNKNELVVSELSGKKPLRFRNEKIFNKESEKVKVLPLENKKITNWTYPGKEPVDTVDWGAVTDSVIDTSNSTPKINFKLKVETSLVDAIKATKAVGHKFLIVYSDPDNKSAQAYFDAFIKSQEETIGYNFYDSYDSKYDVYNYYLTTPKDKKWLNNNKITDFPSIIILDESGTVLAIAKSNLTDKQYQFAYYGALYGKLKKVRALIDFSKIVADKKSNDAELIKTFNDVSILVGMYDDYYNDESNESDFKFAKSTLDKKQVQLVWEKLITAHQKDVKPNMMLVESILAEIKNAGFSKLIFDEDKILNDTDFKSIEYLIKHYDAIESLQVDYDAKDDTRVAIGDVSTEISRALQNSTILYVNGEVKEKSDQKKVMATYQKLISGGKGNFESYRSYLYYLTEKAKDGDPDNLYLKEFDTYFNKMLVTQENVIQRLDEMYSADVSSSYFGWKEFKEYHTNLCNDAAWFTVLNSNDATFIKKAIKWSEYSLVVKKNDPYYLDTLAQLYYKDGQKEKAIKTQQQAVELSKDVEEETKIEMQETLVKMQNGTY